MRRLVPFACGLVLAAGAAWAEDEADPEWTKFASCAAAYRVNAKVADPDRSAQMKAQVSELGRDYETAATQSYREAKRGSVAVAREAIMDYVRRAERRFSGEPREAVEAFIEACPQIDAK